MSVCQVINNIIWWQRWANCDDQRMAQLRLVPPELFNFQTPNDWPSWKRRFEQFLVASKLATDDALKQEKTLLYCIGEETKGVLASMNTTEAEQKVYKTALRKFDNFFKFQQSVRNLQKHTIQPTKPAQKRDCGTKHHGTLSTSSRTR